MKALKAGLDRPRPPPAWRDRAVLQNHPSYPRGHSTSSIIGYGMLVYALTHGTLRPSRRLFAVCFFASLVAAVGFSRIYLRAHWCSDVVGGFLLGLTWLCLGLWRLELPRPDAKA